MKRPCSAIILRPGRQPTWFAAGEVGLLPGQRGLPRGRPVQNLAAPAAQHGLSQPEYDWGHDDLLGIMLAMRGRPERLKDHLEARSTFSGELCGVPSKPPAERRARLRDTEMELPRRSGGDELLKSGELLGLRDRLRTLSHRHDLATVIACAFDHRTRMLPFIYAERRMAPAGVRAIGSAMVDVGFPKTRIVLQQWNPNFRPAQMRLDGRIPDLFLVSSMQMHSAPANALLRDACSIDPAPRPLIVAGGPRAI